MDVETVEPVEIVESGAVPAPAVMPVLSAVPAPAADTPPDLYVLIQSAQSGDAKAPEITLVGQDTDITKLRLKMGHLIFWDPVIAEKTFPEEPDRNCAMVAFEKLVEEAKTYPDSSIAVGERRHLLKRIELATSEYSSALKDLDECTESLREAIQAYVACRDRTAAAANTTETPNSSMKILHTNCNALNELCSETLPERVVTIQRCVDQCLAQKVYLEEYLKVLDSNTATTTSAVSTASELVNTVVAAGAEVIPLPTEQTLIQRAQAAVKQWLDFLDTNNEDLKTCKPARLRNVALLNEALRTTDIAIPPAVGLYTILTECRSDRWSKELVKRALQPFNNIHSPLKVNLKICSNEITMTSRHHEVSAYSKVIKYVICGPVRAGPRPGRFNDGR